MAVNDFFSGLSKGLGDAGNVLYRMGQLERQRELDELRARADKRAEELQPLALEAQQLQNEASRIKNEGDQNALDQDNFNNNAVKIWGGIEGKGNFVSRGTDGRTYDFDWQNIYDRDRNGFVELFNLAAPSNLNLGYGDDGKTLKANQIADIQKIPKERGGGWTIINRRTDGSSVGPITENTSTDPNDNVVILSDEQMDDLAQGVMSDTWIAGRFNLNTRDEGLDAINDQLQAFTDAYVRDMTKQAAAENADPSLNPGLFRQLLAEIQSSRGQDLDDLLIEISGGKVDPEAVKQQAYQEFQRKKASMYRSDGSRKSARGFLGPVQNQVDGGTMTEVSIGVEIDGVEQQIPAMVPGLTQDEINTLANMQIEGNAKNIPESIQQKAVDHARRRISEGKPVFYQDGEELVDELKSLSTTDQSGRVTYSNPARAEELKAQLRKNGISDDVIELTTDSDIDDQNYLEIAADELVGFGKWVKDNPADAAILGLGAFMFSNPLGLAARGAVATVRATPAAARWLVKKGLLRQKKGGNRSDVRKNQRASKEDIQANQEQRRVDTTFNNRPDYSEFDIPKPLRTQRGMEAQVGMRSTGTQSGTAQTGATQSSRFMPDGYEVSPKKVAGVVAGGLLYKKATSDDEPSDIEKQTGVRPQFTFDSDEAVRQAIIQEANNPDQAAVKRYMQSKGMTASNIGQKIKQVPTREQLQIMFTIAKNSPGSVKDQLEMLQKLQNLFLTGSQTRDQYDVLQFQTAYLQEQRLLEKQRFDQNKSLKPDRGVLDGVDATAKTLRDLITTPEGGYTLENQGTFLNGLTELVGKSENATNRTEKTKFSNQIVDLTAMHMQALASGGDASWYEIGKMLDNFFNKDAKVRAGSMPAARLLRAETGVVNGKEQIVALYFRDPSTKSKRTDVSIPVSKLQNQYGGLLVQELVKIAEFNTAVEPVLQNQSGG